MLTFTLSLNLEGAAFEEPDTELELARILRGVADQIESTRILESADDPVKLRDANGNAVGSWIVTEES